MVLGCGRNPFPEYGGYASDAISRDAGFGDGVNEDEEEDDEDEEEDEEEEEDDEDEEEAGEKDDENGEPKETDEG